MGLATLMSHLGKKRNPVKANKTLKKTTTIQNRLILFLPYWSPVGALLGASEIPSCR